MKFREKDVAIQSNVVLKGTLNMPENRAEKLPAVLIIPGTGKLDRNGRVNEKLDLKLYRQLAEFVSNMGFISLRYDKRGIGESKGDYYLTGMWDLVQDARSCVRFLKELPEVDPENIIVLGHSEGSMLGTAVAAREDLAGLILLAGAVESLNEAMKRQRDIATQDVLEMKGFYGFFLRLLGTQNKIEKQAQKLINKVLSSNEDVMKYSMAKTNAKWMREHFQYNPREDLAKITCPVLAITGDRDIQANPKVVSDLPKYVKGTSEYYVIENMGHSCKFQTKTSTILTVKKDIFAEVELPIHPDLKQKLEKWLQKILVKSPKDNQVTV